MMLTNSSYLIIHFKKCCFWDLFLSLVFLKKLDLRKVCECSDDSVDLEEFNDHWRARLSLFLAKSLDVISEPLARIGDVTGFVLNLLAINGGLIKTVIKLLNGSRSIPQKGSVNFLSIVGLLEHRKDLYNSEGQQLVTERVLPAAPGDRLYADLCAMASTLAYENKRVVECRVTTCWKMHFLEFYNFWNENLKEYCTKAFTFCDREEDAHLVVLCFRGTDCFNADDWKTDLDLSWYRLANVGRVHLGFMEALGMANRHEDDVMRNLYNINSNNDEETPKPLAYYTLVAELLKLLEIHKNAKLILTGHSLGGALAVLFSMLLIVKDKKEIMQRLMGVYTFGQPRVGDEEFCNFMDSNLNSPRPRYFRFVYCNDIVPRVPYDDDLFLFKHFGTCLYYNSLYKEKNCKQEPNRNFSLLYFVPIRLNAVWEVLVAIFLPFFKGADYRENSLCIFMRISLGLVIPGVVSHCLVNYINSVRLGPSPLEP